MTPDEFIKNPLFVTCAEKAGFRRLNSDEPLIEKDVLNKFLIDSIYVI